jgi:hypothetical protein
MITCTFIAWMRAIAAALLARMVSATARSAMGQSGLGVVTVLIDVATRHRIFPVVFSNPWREQALHSTLETL